MFQSTAILIENSTFIVQSYDCPLPLTYGSNLLLAHVPTRLVSVSITPIRDNCDIGVNHKHSYYSPFVRL